MKIPIHYLRKSRYYLTGKWKAMKLPANVLQNAHGKVVIGFHGIDLKNNTAVNTKFVSVKKFEEEIKLLAKHTNLVSLNDYVTDKLNPDKLNVAITFDDGFQNNYFLAKPILEKYNTPAAFFITPIWYQQKNILWSDLIDNTTKSAPASFTVGNEQYRKNIFGNYFHSSGEPIHPHVMKQNRAFINELYHELLPYAKFMEERSMDIYWKLMTDQQVKYLSAHPLFTIGAHGFTHTDLTNLSDEEVMDELTTSKNILENLIQKKVEFFASPFGAHNERTIELTRKAGYSYQVFTRVTNGKWENQKDIIPRSINNPYLSPYHQILFIANKKF